MIQCFVNGVRWLLFHAGRFVADNDDLLVLLDAAKVDDPIEFCDLSRVFRTPRFKKFCDPCEAAGDVLRLL